MNRKIKRALISHPLFGSLWLEECEITSDEINGICLDDSDKNSSFLPYDYSWEYIIMTFPITCIRKTEYVT